MLNLQNISYSHPNKSILFEQLHLHLQPRQKMALIGNNGVGKSTLLRIIAGELSASSGCVKTTVKPYYVPQLVGQFTNCTVARVLRIEKKWRALQAILNGDVSEAQLDALEEDWSIEERCKQVLANWQLSNLDLQQSIEKLSGGEKAKLLLAGMELHQPELVLLDEPSNHLDLTARGLLYDFLGKTTAAMLLVSHDRNLLNLLDLTGEMTSSGIQLYGGNYDFF
ncbi:ATP-binding cassette domain-containing protein [Flavihumibacter sp. CACIAM 22H1]|uniref:ATP-binding cassette domain-containing protein n=1 Tax=Flavihumibacter sp. CACIAM 22H1 TaxID=1812911 RepID=UPI000AECA7CA|nr:ATP-binding cassette domain-containing protein [Flavihumibacter sp. CACIAM 22H1]